VRITTPGAGWDSAVDASASCLRSVPAISNQLHDAASASALTLFLFLMLTGALYLR